MGKVFNGKVVSFHYCDKYQHGLELMVLHLAVIQWYKIACTMSYY
jgi:hypothetical protein